MKISLIILSVLLVTMIIAGAYGETSRTMPLRHFKFPLGNEMPANVPVYPYVPDASTFIYTIGTTFWDIETLGPAGNRIEIYDNGGGYYLWTNLYGWPYPLAPCYIYYNWRPNNDPWHPDQEGLPVSQTSPSYFPSLSCFEDNRGVIAYHGIFTNESDKIIIAIEWEPGLSIYDYYIVPNEIYPQTQDYPGTCYWPQVAVDTNDNIHIVMHENTNGGPFRIAYTRSEDGGATWTEPVVIDTCTVIGTAIEASDISDEVILAWSKPRDLSSQWHNDIVYVKSEDGLNWDFEYGITNLTDYANDSDSLWAYNDLDILVGENTYFLWTAQWVTDQGVYWPTYLFLYNETESRIDEIYHHPDSLFDDICGAWNRPISKVNLATPSSDSGLFVFWVQYDTLDVSATSFGNGDIYYMYTHDSEHWSEKENFTHTITPGCYPGECGNESQLSLYRNTDEYLHLLYIRDMDAGSVIMGEGSATENPVLYNEYWIAGIFRTGSLEGYVTESDSITPVEGVTIKAFLFDYEANIGTTDNDGHYYLTPYCGYYNIEASKDGYYSQTIQDIVIPWDLPITLDFQLERVVGIDDTRSLPYSFQLDQNYPNPFNAQTTISFSLKNNGPVKLEIFDITGSLVETLIDRFMPPGKHDIIWNAENAASGVYLYKLTYGENTSVKKAVLVK